jgi:hypothetical protein
MQVEFDRKLAEVLSPEERALLARDLPRYGFLP